MFAVVRPAACVCVSESASKLMCVCVFVNESEATVHLNWIRGDRVPVCVRDSHNNTEIVLVCYHSANSV